MAKKKPVKLSKKAAKAQNKLSVIGNQLSASKSENNIAVEKKVVEMPAVLTVREFADTLKLPVTKIIASLVDRKSVV